VDVKLEGSLFFRRCIAKSPLGKTLLMVSDPLAMNMSNTLGYLRGELKDVGKTSSPKGKKYVSLGKRVLEVGFIKKMLLAVYNKIFSWYYS